jgi:hypothetical protein
MTLGHELQLIAEIAADLQICFYIHFVAIALIPSSENLISDQKYQKDNERRRFSL